jgi:WD40 repeat protein
MKQQAKIALSALFVAVLCTPTAANAAFPGSNGKLAFVRDGQIWTMDAGGTGQTQLTTGLTTATEPEWSPDGTRILYTRGTSCGTNCTRREVRVMNADGTGDAHVYGPGGYGVFSPTWSPDGKRVAFIVPDYVGPGCCHFAYQIYTADLAGSDLDLVWLEPEPQQLSDLAWSPKGDELAYTRDAGFNFYKLVNVKGIGSGTGPARNLVPTDPENWTASAPSWSPDATRVGYLVDTRPATESDVAVVNSDGTGETPLTADDVQQYGEEWSPDGTKIAFSGQEPGCASDCNPELYVMNADGTGSVRLTNTIASSETSPDWQPVVGSAPAGYPRPKGASPLRVALVPAYQRCTSPNRTHGTPLAFQSCTPPNQASPNLTVGTPDANGAPANMVGSLRMDVVTGDVNFTFNVRDVRCRTGVTGSPCTNPNVQAGADYFGQLTIRLPVRVTDHYNLPAPGGNSPATGDTTMTFFAYCTATSDTSIGSTCPLTSSVKAWYPGGVQQGRRAVFELGQVEVLDGGPDGRGANAVPFLRQGLFVP